MISRFKLSLVVALLLSLALLPAITAAASSYTPHQGDYFSFYEVEHVGNGTGSYNGYTDQTVVNGVVTINGVNGDGTVSAYYSYPWSWSDNAGDTETGGSSGNFTFSPTTFLYVNGTDNQTGYVNPTVWFYIDNSLPKGSILLLLNTEMTVMSKNYSYYLPSQNRYVEAIFAQGTSSYMRNDDYGQFTATYTWNAYFDPSTGYIIGYTVTEQDTSPSGDGFGFTDNLYVNSTSYALTAASSPGTGSSGGGSDATQLIEYVAIIAIVIVVIGAIAYALSRRGRGRGSIPKHPYREVPPPPPDIDLTPKEQPAVQQIVIKEVAKVKCSYCGALIDSTAKVCPQCGAPRN